MNETMMKAVAIERYLEIIEPGSLVDVTVPRPHADGHDLLVQVAAIAVNPVDTKVRRGRGQAAGKVETPPRIIGWDASGVVQAVGEKVTRFRPGDEVYYAGDLNRPGSYAQFQLVDERIVGRRPMTLAHHEAAALPLTTITAYESLFDRLQIDRDGGSRGQSLLIIGGSGGVGSIGIQLARHAGLTVIATASRPQTQAWVSQLGADHVISHQGDMVAAVRSLGFRFIDHIAIFNDMRHWDVAVELVRPQGRIVCIDDTHLPMPMEKLKSKACSVHWEFMFARSMHQTPDMAQQGLLLSWVAQQVDDGRIRTTVSERLTPINAENLRIAHQRVESGTARGKIVVDGF